MEIKNGLLKKREKDLYINKNISLMTGKKIVLEPFFIPSGMIEGGVSIGKKFTAGKIVHYFKKNANSAK